MFLNLLIISAKKPRAKEKVKDSQTDQTEDNESEEPSVFAQSLLN